MESVVKTKTTLKAIEEKRGHLSIYLWCLSFLKPYKWLVLLFIVSGLVVSGVQLLIPKFIEYFIDHIIPARNTSLFLWLLVGIAMLLVFMILANGVKNLLQRMIQEKTSRDLQYTIFKKLRLLGFSHFEQTPTGETLSLFSTEIPAVQGIYRQYFPRLVQMLVMLMISVALIVATSVKLSLIILPFFLSYYLIGPFFERKAGELAKQTNENRTALNKKIYDSISALLELRAYGAEQWDRNRLMDTFAEFKRTSLMQLLNALLRGTVRRVSVNLGAVVMFLYGAYLLKENSLLLGQFVAFTFYYFRVMGDLTYVITSITEQRLLLHQAEPLHDLIHKRVDVAEPKEPITLNNVQGQLTFNHIHFSYRPDVPVIEGFDLDIKPGERVALVGTSGNGKSTLFKLIGRFYDPQQGEILLDNVPLRDIAFEQLRNAVGYVFQETYLFGTTVKENIRFGKPDASDEEIMEAAKSAFAHEFIEQLPQGYDTFVGERCIKLSGGQKQRIGIARMLIKNPRIVVLDEATSALDQVSEKEVQLALDVLLRGRTTIASAHRLSTIQDYDRIIVMDKGRIAEMGTYSELIQKQGLFQLLAQGELTED